MNPATADFLADAHPAAAGGARFPEAEFPEALFPGARLLFAADIVAQAYEATVPSERQQAPCAKKGGRDT